MPEGKFAARKIKKSDKGERGEQKQECKLFIEYGM